MSNKELNVFQLKHEAICEAIDYRKQNPDEVAFEDLDHRERVKKVKEYLKAIVERVGCNDYLFTLGITELYERFGKRIVPELWEILDNYCEYANEINFDITRNDAFAALYCLVHHYYRQSDLTRLQKLLMPKEDFIHSLSEYREIPFENVNFSNFSDSAYYKTFEDYPLIFEMLGRYFSVKGDYSSQLKMAKIALKLLDKTKGLVIKYGNEIPYVQQGENYGAKISCAGAVCSILEDNYLYGKLSVTTKRNVSGQSEFIKSAFMRNDSVDKSDLSEVFDYIGRDGVSRTESYVDEAMNFAVHVLNNDYPKYHYLKAKIKFYSAVLNNYLNGNTFRELPEKPEIEAQIDKAVELEELRSSHDVEKRTYTYTCLKNYVNGYTGANLDRRYHQARRSVISASNIKKLNKDAYPKLKRTVTGGYVFISYSSQDFKPVYCDLLAMERNGINYWYDRGTQVGVDWKEVVRRHIKNCSAVLYYMSEQSVASQAVMDELNYILELNKPIICINLCGNSVTSKTLISIIRDGSGNAVSRINSNTFKTVCTACPDYIVMLQRDRDPLNVYHIDKLRSDLLKTYPSTIRYAESNSYAETGSDKTYVSNSGKTVVRQNEDYLICDKRNNIFIVADGISRSPEEYKQYLGESENGEKSIARLVSEVFSENLHGLIKETILNAQSEESFERDFERAFETANKAVENFLLSRSDYYWTRRYIKGCTYYEKPGCVAIAAFIFGGKLYYGSVGDCMGILIRSGRKIIFSDKQTDYAFKHMNVENDRPKLYSEYVNKPENPYGYGVVNGDENAVKFFSAAHLELEAGDEIYIVSDGISDYIKFGDVDKISKCTLPNLMKNEDKRRLGLKIKNDDKAIIRIKIH